MLLCRLRSAPVLVSWRQLTAHAVHVRAVCKHCKDTTVTDLIMQRSGLKRYVSITRGHGMHVPSLCA